MGLWFLVSGCFSTKRWVLPVPLKTLSVFIWRKIPWLLEWRKNVSAHIFFSGKKQIWQVTLIFPESRHCLYFPSKLPMLRKINLLRQPYLYNYCPDLQQPGKVLPICLSCLHLNEGSKTILWYMSQCHKRFYQALDALCGDRYISPALEIKCLGKTSCLLSFFNYKGQGSKLCYCPSGKRAAPTWWHESSSTVQRQMESQTHRVWTALFR